MKIFLSLILKNLAGMITAKFFIWGAKLAAKQTKHTLIDDNVVRFVEAASKNDVEGVKAAIEGIANELNEKGQAVEV